MTTPANAGWPDVLLPWADETVMATLAAVPAADAVFGEGVKVIEPAGDQWLRLFPPFDAIRLATYESLPASALQPDPASRA